MRVMVATAESPGHAFPGIALGLALSARGHDVTVRTSDRWREVIESRGLRAAASEDVGGGDYGGTWGASILEATRSLLPLMREIEPDVVVSDVVIAAPSLAAEIVGAKHATLMPVMYPEHPRGFPAYPLGMLPPRTRPGELMWRVAAPMLTRTMPRTRWRRGVARLLNEVRSELGLAPISRPYGEISSYGHAISRRLTLVATFPQLEYPRRWPAHVHVTGPMLFEVPGPESTLPEGDEPLVLVAASTTMDPQLDLQRVALEALAREPVRLVATTGGRRWLGAVPGNAAVVEWVSHSQVSSQAGLVISVGGHGTVARALAYGLPHLVCPGGGDMAANGAHVTWAGVGLMLPRPLLRPVPLRLAVRRLLDDGRFARRAREIAAWGREHDPPAEAAELVERYAAAR